VGGRRRPGRLLVRGSYMKPGRRRSVGRSIHRPLVTAAGRDVVRRAARQLRRRLLSQGRDALSSRLIRLTLRTVVRDVRGDIRPVLQRRAAPLSDVRVELTLFVP